MKLYGIDYAEPIAVRATAAGTETWISWIQRVETSPIELIAPAAALDTLPDFLNSDLDCVLMSPRAFDVLGAKAFKFVGAVSINGAAGHAIGFCWKTKAVLEMSGRNPVIPLRLSGGAPSPDGMFFQVSGEWKTYRQFDGEFFVTAATWLLIQEAGLTGLVKVGEYEVLEAQ